MDQTKDSKRSNAQKAAVVLLLALAVVAAGWAVTNTLAKYATKLEATSSAPVARFEIGAEFTAEDGTKTVLSKDKATTVNLFKVGKQKNESGADNDAVAEGKIAPGTTGEFEFDVKNGSEVDVECAVVCDLAKVAATGVPLVFSMDNGATWSTVGADTVSGVPVDLAKAADPAKPTSKTLKVLWKWEYERGTTADEKAKANEADTKLGEEVANNAIQPVVDLDVTFTQKQG